MKKLRQYSIILLALVMIIPLFGLSSINALDNQSLDNIKIDASNYNQYREQLEKEANGNNVIDRTISQTYMFGTYAKTQIDGWNVDIISTSVGTDGYHTIKFKAQEGYQLPAQTVKGDTRFAKVSVSYMSGQRYTVENDVGILKFKPDFTKFNTISNYVAPDVVYTHLVAIPDGTKEKDYLNDYVFIEVEHQGQDYNLTQVYTGITPIVSGSRTYLVKKNTPLKVYYMNQEHMKPIETQPSTTGVSYQHDDYKNRYCVINGSNIDTTNKVLSYDTTIFNVFVYSYTQQKWIRLNSYDFYHADNTVNMPAYNNENITFPGMEVVGFSVQELIYQPHMKYDQVWQTKKVGLDYSFSTKSTDYNVQWTSTGVDGGVDNLRYSSLRHRFGDVYITPVYQNKYTVRFLDYDGTILDAQKVLKGKDAVAPTDPTRENYTFEGWDKDYKNIQGDLDVHATYKEIVAPIEPDTNKVKVTFVDYDGTVLKEESLDKGGNATAPTSPLRDGYKFIGWDKTFENVQNDLVVTALYEEVQNIIITPIEPELPDIPTPPTTPDTPVVTTPTVNTTVTPNTNRNDQTVIEDPQTPQGNGNTVIKDNETPLANISGAWAFVNLICVLLTIVAGLILIISKHQEEEDQKDCKVEETNEYKRRRWTKAFTTLVAVVSIIVFILTEDMTLPMQMIDKYTVVMVVIFVIQLIVLMIGRKWKKEKNENIQATNL